MGVDYSASVGYGLAMMEDEANEYLRGLNPHEDGDIPGIMAATGWDAVIGYDYCGDWMSREAQVYFFYVKGTEVLHFDIGVEDTITDFGDSSFITMSALDALADLRRHFGIRGSVGWKLIANVN